jgi:hypothetical protein
MVKPMAAEERDRIFDQALRRHLRSVAPAGEAAGISNVSASQSGACPDPETLAAYHERSLLPEQLNSLKEHIAGCPNCQTVLALLQRTDEIPLEAAHQEQSLAPSAATPMAAASSQAPAPSPAALPRKSRRARLLRGARWQWLAPAGAIAAGLLLWIAFHENYTPPRPSRSENEIKMAQNKVPPSPAARSTAVPPSSAAEKSAATLTHTQSPAGEPAIANRPGFPVATKQSPAPSEATGGRLADSLSDKEGLRRTDRERDASADALTAANNANLDAKKLPEELRKKEDAAVEAAKIQAEIAQLQNSQTQNQSSNYISPKVPGPSPMSQMESSRKSKSTVAAAPAAVPAAPPPPPEKTGVVSSHDDSTSLKLGRALSSPLLISPPGSNTFWRVGRSGLIEFSRDGGSSWTRQSSGVVADLLTGSAPSDQVCWIVGRVGAILLTTDGGAHWKIVPSPLAEDLGGVRAADALHTTIWNARATKSFETSDGGLTWKPVPNP